MGRLLRLGLGGILVVVLLLVIVGLLFGGGDETASQGSGGPTAPEEPGAPEQETFTKDNYAELASNPDAHEGANVDVTGKLLGAPESGGGETAFQMFADPANSEWSTIVHYDDDVDLNPDEYVRVTGSVLGSFEGENAFGASMTATEVQADLVEVVDAGEALDPAQKTVQAEQKQGEQGFTITLQKLEFGEDTTRAYVSLYNETGVPASFYAFNSRIIQGSSQIEPTDSYEYAELEPQSDVSPGVRSQGVVTFDAVDPDRPFEMYFEWSSEDYSVTANPIAFYYEP